MDEVSAAGRLRSLVRLVAALEAALGRARGVDPGASEGERLGELIDELETLLVQARAMLPGGERASVVQGLSSATTELRALTDSSSILVWLADAGRAGVYFNASWLRFTGRPLQGERGRGWLDGIHADDRPGFDLQLDEAYARCRPFRAELRLRSADGSYRWIVVEGNPLHGPDGEFLGCVGFCSDIHERKRIEVALDHLASRYAQLSGTVFYEAVCRHLAQELELDFVFVGELTAGGDEVVVRGGWADGGPMAALTYELVGSPCEEVIARAQCAFPAGAAKRFPLDVLLSELGIEGYCGTPLRDSEGRPFGLMVGLSRRPIESVPAVHALMDVFDDRVGAEMQRERSADALDRRVAFERLVSDVSSQLILVQLGELDDAIESALGAIGEFVDGDRMYVFMMHEHDTCITNTHEWCAPGIEPEIHNLQEVPFGDDVMFARRIRRHRIVDIQDVSQLPAGSTDREVLEAQSVRSTLAIPMVSNRLIGFIGVDAVRAVRRWTDEDKTLLMLASNAFTSVFERKEMDQSLRDSESRYRSVVENVRDVIFQAGIDGRWIFLNAAWERLSGYSVAESVGRPLFEHFAADDDGDFEARFAQLVSAPQGEYRGELRCRCKDGSLRWLDACLRVNASADGEVLGVSGTLNDISDRKRATDRQKLLASVFTHANEAILITDGKARIIEVNEAFSRITGYARKEVLGRNATRLGLATEAIGFFRELRDTLHGTGQWQGESRVPQRSGDSFPALLKVSALRDERGRVQQYLALFSDITVQKSYQQQLEFIAQHDALTGLPNRVLLQDRLQQGMAHARRRGSLLAVVYIDLDGFKAVNDRYGHHIGDQLLVALASRMRTILREGDSIARLGGDEFVAVLLDLADQDSSMPLVLRLLTALARPVAVAGHELRVSASIGLTYYPQAEEVDADQLLRQADQAMYDAKVGGKNRFWVFDTAKDRSTRGRNESVARIRKGLRIGEFVLHYQPKVNMRTGQLVGAEALIRWQHPENGLTSPAAFLPAIEDHDAAVELGEWVIDAALRQIADWQVRGLDLPVSVNIGARHLQAADFMERLRRLLQSHPNVPPQRLELEVLETSALESMAHVSRIVEECAEIGVSSALDDFGTGYSSLAYLKRLPAAHLKIDQLFVRDMLDDPDDLAILEAVLGLASAFRRGVIAEGVETAAHGKLLLQLGCEVAQGYGIGRPMPASQVLFWANSWRPPASWREAKAVARADVPLAYAIVEHRALLGALESYVTGESGRPPALGQTGDHLRDWLDARAGASGTPAVRELDFMHRQLQGAVRELIADVHGGRRFDPSLQLAHAARLRDELIVHLEALLDASG